MRVLIIDDSKMMRLMHARSLRQAGYQPQIAEAGNGEEALAVLESHQPELIIVDWNMPGMDGIEFVQELRKREQEAKKPRTPVLMITSQSTEEQFLHAREAGVDRLLAKPVSPESLSAALDMLLAGAR